MFKKEVRFLHGQKKGRRPFVFCEKNRRPKGSEKISNGVFTPSPVYNASAEPIIAAAAANAPSTAFSADRLHQTIKSSARRPISVRTLPTGSHANQLNRVFVGESCR